VRRLSLTLSLLLLAPLSTLAQAVRFQSQVIGSRGLPLGSQNVAVCTQPANTNTTPCSPLATLATSAITNSGGTNPTTTDVNGNFFFYLPANTGKVTIQIFGPQVATPFVQPDVVVPADLSQNLTFTGANTFSKVNGICVVDGTQNTTIVAAVSCLGGVAGEVYIPTGTNAPTGQIVVGASTCFRGAGMNASIVKPTAALAATLFSVTGSGDGYCFQDLTIDMTNVPTRNAIDFIPTSGTISQPFMKNVRIIYPVGGTGRAINIANSVGEVHFSALGIQSAGYCVYIQGDNAAEHFYTDITCQSPTTAGFFVTRTTVSDQGGYYLKSFKVTNPGGVTTSQGFVLAGAAGGINGANPFWCIDCVADSIIGGHNFNISNWSNVFITGATWSTNTAIAANNFSALFASNVFGLTVDSGNWISNSRDVTLANSIGNGHLVGLLLIGGATNLYAAGATLTNVQFRPGAMDGSTVISGADASLITNAISGASNGGNAMEVWVSSAGTAAQTLHICNKDVGTPAPCKAIRVNASNGNFEIFNNAYTASTLTIPDAAVLTAPALTATLTATIANGTAAMTTAAIGAGACGTTVTVAATGVATTDTITVAFNAAPAGTNAGLTAWPTANNVNFAYCPGVAETPAAATINWRVVR